MSQYNIRQAKARFSALVRLATLGQEVIIAKNNKPVAKLVPLTPVLGLRKPGSAKRQIWMAPGFDASLKVFEDHPR